MPTDKSREEIRIVQGFAGQIEGEDLIAVFGSVDDSLDHGGIL